MHYIAQVSREGRFRLIDFPDAPAASVYAEEGEEIREVAREAIEVWLARQLDHGITPARPMTDALAHGGDVLQVNIELHLAVRLQLRWARQDAGVSQGQLAKKIGVSRQQISLLESPDANLTLRTLDTLAAALGLEVDISLVRPSDGER